MKCPPEVSDILLAILQTGLLSIRARGGADDSVRCAIEADHLHNLPALLANYSTDLLRFYWDVERTAYKSQSKKEDLAIIEDLWNRLEPLVSGDHIPSLVS